MSNPRGLSGLGIDMGPPEPRAAPLNGPRPRSGTQPLQIKQQSASSQLPRRPPIASSGSSSADERRVRIASGQPGVMGHEESETDGSPSSLSSPDSMTTSSGSGDGKRYSSGPMNRNKRLGAAVAAMSSDSSRWDSTPSDMYSSDTSPTTDSSATSYSSLRSKGSNSSLKREFTIRKQRSQPNLSRTHTLVSRGGRSNTSSGPPPASSSGMGRSKSSLSLSSQYRSSEAGSESGTSLGRTSEIPRSGSRSGSFTARGRGRGGSFNRGSGRRNSYSSSHASAQLRGPSEMAATAATQESRLIPDGFGGYVEADRAASQMKPPSEVGTNQPPSQRQQQQQQQQQQQRNQLPVPRPVQHQRQKSDSSAQGQKAFDGPATLRVGSFYGPDGSETARLDEEGRLSRNGTARTRSSTTNRPKTAPLQGTAPESVTGRTYSVISSQRSHSSGPPKPRFMSSPNAPADVHGEHEQEVEQQPAQQTQPRDPAQNRASQSLHKSTSQMSMRSQRGWKGLDGAERGEAMVSLDKLNASFDQGETILPGRVKTAEEDSILASARLSQADHNERNEPVVSRHKRQMSAPTMLSEEASRSNVSLLDRQPTLISTSATPARRSRELSRLLANSNRKVASSSASSSASSMAGESIASGSTDSLASTKSGASRMNAAMPPAVLEQGRQGKARVDVDLVLESDLVVEGGILRGRLEIKVRKNNDKDGPLMLTHPKVRVVGFEELLNDDTRHIFYHHATVVYGERKVGGPARPYVLHGTPSLSSPEADGGWEPLPCFASHPDNEGFCRGKEGTHSIPFALEMPVGKGAKGSYRGKHALVRYIVIGSVKLKSSGSNPNRSIAHFYRHVELYPYLNPAVVLSSAHRPVQARASKGLFLGGSGKVHLTASLHRTTWVAGQRVYVNVNIQNDTSKKVKSLTLALVRTVTLYRPRPEFDMGISAPDDPTDTYVDPDACTTSTSRKKISEEVLEMGQKGSKGVVTARGWWTGVDGGGGAVDFSHYMNLPGDALTVSRGRHVEVLYSIKVSVSSSLSADVSVELPLRVVNFVSLDPPPIKNPSANVVARSWNPVASKGGHDRNAMSDSEAPNIARIRSMEALRSPSARVEQGLGITSHVEPSYPMLNGSQGLPQQQQQQLQQQQPSSGYQLGQPLQPAHQRLQSDSRRLQHQKSLDFINHAIRSATARRGGQAPSNGNSTGDEVSPPMGLGISVEEKGEATPSQRSITSSATGPSDPSCEPYVHSYNNKMPFAVPTTAVSLDDLADDDSDEGEDEAVADRTLGLNDDSVDEVDLVIGSARLEGESTPAWESRQPRFQAGNDSTDTVTSAPGIKEDDEDEGYNDDDDDDFDEEEERLRNRTETVPEEERENEEGDADYSEYEAPRQALQHQQTRRTSAEADKNFDDGPTPIARSPPKFQSKNPSPTKLAIPRASSNIDLKHSAQRKSTSTGVRPISPSKNAPSPTKSALKSKSSFTFATSDSPLKVSPTPPQSSQAQAVEKQTLRAKVEPGQIPPPNAARASVQNRSPKKAVLASPPKKAASSPKKVPGASPASSNASLDTASPSSRSSYSPATSVDEIKTPESTHMSELTASDSSKTIVQDDAYQARGLGLDLGDDEAIRPKVSSIPRPAVRGAAGGRREGFTRESSAPPTVRPLGPVAQKSPSKQETMSKSISMAAIPRPDATTTGGSGEDQRGLERSTSTHNLRGSSVVLPSVRDKIAQLEQRKKALNEFTSTDGGTPTKLGTPTKGQHRGLERQESFLSEASTDVSSTSFVRDHVVRQQASQLSFKAPLFKR